MEVAAASAGPGYVSVAATTISLRESVNPATSNVGPTSTSRRLGAEMATGVDDEPMLDGPAVDELQVDVDDNGAVTGQF